MPRTRATFSSATYSAPAMQAALGMRANIAARVRADNQIATKCGFARTNGGYICLNRWLRLTGSTSSRPLR